MNQGISVTEACETGSLTEADYARLCTQQGNDMVLWIAIGGAIVFVLLVSAILLTRRGAKR